MDANRQYQVIVCVYWGIAAVVIAAVSFNWIDDFWTKDNWIYRYQTLMTGGLAVVAAGFLYRAAKQQIDENRELAEAAKEQTTILHNRRLAAAIRAVLLELRPCIREANSLLSKYGTWKSTGRANRMNAATADAFPSMDKLPREINSVFGDIQMVCDRVPTICKSTKEAAEGLISAFKQYNAGGMSDAELKNYSSFFASELSRDYAVAHATLTYLQLNSKNLENNSAQQPAAIQVPRNLLTVVSSIVGVEPTEIEKEVSQTFGSNVFIFEIGS